MEGTVYGEAFGRQALTRRGFVGGILSFGALAGCGTLGRGEQPLVKFGVVSDVHVRLASPDGTLAAGYDTATFEKALAYYRDCGVDAVMIAGDIADLGLVGELKAVADAWYRVFPGDRAPDGRKVERLFVFGNHDAFGLKNGARMFPDPAALRREAIEADPRRAWDECFHEEWKPYFAKNVKGFDFFCSHWQPGIWCNGIAETGCNGCADAFGALMRKCDPSKPFFYVQHPHPRETVYGKCAWGMDDGTAVKLLSEFPQAVAFSGHSHEPLTNEKAIWRGGFMSVATGSLRYLSASSVWNFANTAGYENGGCNYYLPGVTRKDRPAYVRKYDAPKVMTSETTRPDIRVGQTVSVYEDRIVFEKREFTSGLLLGEDWTVELPAKSSGFAVRAKAARPAEFPAGAALAVSRTTAKTRGMNKYGEAIEPESKPTLRLDFPAATAGGRVAEYEVSVENAAGESRVVRICAVGGFYPAKLPKFAEPAYAMLSEDSLPKGATVVRVTPLDSFGNRGRPLEAKLA